MPKEFIIINKDEKEVKLCIKLPSREDIVEADKVYATKVASLIKSDNGDKLLLRQQLEKFLESQNIWTSEDQKSLEKLQKDIDNMKRKLDKGGIPLSEGRKIAISMMDKHGEIFSLLAKRQSFDAITIEAIAEAERTDYIIYASTVLADNGEKYWASFADMVSEKNENSYQLCATNVLEIIYGVDPIIERRFPETKWLAKYKFIDENLCFTDRKTGVPVDRDGNILVNDVIEEIVVSPFIDDETNEPVIVE